MARKHYFHPVDWGPRISIIRALAADFLSNPALKGPLFEQGGRRVGQGFALE
jgi:hypothetical protein